MPIRNCCNNTAPTAPCIINQTGIHCIQLLTGPTGPAGRSGVDGCTGATGCTGPTGMAGLMGPTGATGPKGDKGERGEQGPQGEQGLKGDTSEKGEKGDKGDKGDQGPQGEVGPQGEKGETGAVGATGPKGDKGEKGDKGVSGEKGDKGDTGEKGQISNQNATILHMASQGITSGTPFLLSTILTNNGLVLGGDFITVPATGTYIVTFYVNKATSAAGTDSIAVAIDGTIVRYTSQPLSENATSSGFFVMNLDEGNTVSLIPVVLNATKIEANGGPSVCLTVIKID